MYKALVRRRVVKMFAALTAGDYGPVLRGLAPTVHHRFAGDHPLGGERRNRDAVQAWFERLYRLFPSLAFDLTTVTIAGGPWRTRVTVEWTASVTPAVGAPYRNAGAHVLLIRWGRVMCLHAYEDSQAVATACSIMFDAGVAEAAAPPVEAA